MRKYFVIHGEVDARARIASFSGAANSKENVITLKLHFKDASDFGDALNELKLVQTDQHRRGPAPASKVGGSANAG